MCPVPSSVRQQKSTNHTCSTVIATARTTVSSFASLKATIASAKQTAARLLKPYKNYGTTKRWQEHYKKIENEKEENVRSDGGDNIVPPTWHDRSAFESIGSRMYDDDRIIDDGEGGEGSPATTVTVVQEEDEKERVPSEKNAAANNGGVLDAILEVGTIAAGVFGIALILATGFRSKQSQAAKNLRPCARSCQHLRKQDATKRNGSLKTKS